MGYTGHGGVIALGIPSACWSEIRGRTVFMDEPAFTAANDSEHRWAQPDAPECPHLFLRPCGPDGQEPPRASLATSYWCDACGTPFTLDEAEELFLAAPHAA